MAWTGVGVRLREAPWEKASCILSHGYEEVGVEANFRNDLEWVVKIAGEAAVVLICDLDVPAFGLWTWVEDLRPLQLPQGGIVLCSKRIYINWS